MELIKQKKIALCFFLIGPVTMPVVASSLSSSAGPGGTAASSAPQSQRDPDFLKDAGYFMWGPVRFYPGLATAVGYDDNIFESNSDRKGSTVTRVTPEVTALLPFNAGFAEMGGQINDVRYTTSSDDDFTDRLAYARSAFEAGARNRFTLNGEFAKKHDDRGTVLTEGVDFNTANISEPDAYTDKSAGFNYEFGAPGARGKLRFGANYLDHSYDNNRDRTRYFDHEEYGGSAAFLWRIMPRTSLAFEARDNQIKYAEVNPAATTLDSSERSLLVGAEWGGTGITTGSVRVGNRRKNFESSDRVDGSNFTWEANVAWTPRSYSKFELELEREPNETNGVGDFIDSRTYLLRWSHDWTQRIGTQLALSYVQQAYENTDRDSNLKAAKLGLSYKMRRWLTWHLDGTWRKRSSDVEELSFERNIYWLTAEFTL
jgi:hypothetical protein